MAKNLVTTTNLYVDQNNTTGISPDGSRKNPFPTIQKALDEIVRRQDASSANMYAIIVSSGLYVESLVVRSPFTSIVGMGKNATVIESPDFSSVPLFFSNATLASYAGFLSATGGNPSLFDSNIGILAADSALAFPNNVTSPIGSGVSNCTVRNPAAGSSTCSLVYIGVGPELDKTLDERWFASLEANASFYLRNASNIRMENITAFSAILYIRQLRNANINFSRFRELMSYFNQVEDRSAAPNDTIGFISDIGSTYTVRMRFSQEIIADVKGCVGQDIVLLDTSQATLRQVTCDDIVLNGAVELNGINIKANGNFTTTSASGSPVATVEDIHVGGNIDLGAQTAGSVTFNGGRYMGTLTDPNGVYVGNAGTI